MKVQLPWMSEREHNRTITRTVLFCVHLESSRAAFPFAGASETVTTGRLPVHFSMAHVHVFRCV